MATGSQMVLGVKKNKLNNSSKWFTFGQKIRPQFQATVFLIHTKIKIYTLNKLYKQSGNSIVVDVLMAIVKKVSKTI